MTFLAIFFPARFPQYAHLPPCPSQHAGLMLGQRRRRRANISPALGEQITFTCYTTTLKTSDHRLV